MACSRGLASLQALPLQSTILKTPKSTTMLLRTSFRSAFFRPPFKMSNRDLSTRVQTSSAYVANRSMCFSPKSRRLGHPALLTKDEDEKSMEPTQSLLPSSLQGSPAFMAALPMVPFVGAASMSEPLLGPTSVWLLSSCIPVPGGIALGLPGLAAQVFFLSPIPVMKNIITEKSTGKMPFMPYSSMCASGYLWVVYGMLNDNPAIWLPNIPAFVLGGIFTSIFYKNCDPKANWLPGSRNLHIAAVGTAVATVTGIATMLDTVTACSALGWLGTGLVISMFGGPLAAMKTVIDTKDTSSMSLFMTAATFANCSLWTIYGTCVISDFFIWFPNGLGLLSSIVQFGLFAKFGVGKKEE